MDVCVCVFDPFPKHWLTGLGQLPVQMLSSSCEVGFDTALANCTELLVVALNELGESPVVVSTTIEARGVTPGGS